MKVPLYVYVYCPPLMHEDTDKRVHMLNYSPDSQCNEHALLQFQGEAFYGEIFEASTESRLATLFGGGSELHPPDILIRVDKLAFLLFDDQMWQRPEPATLDKWL